MNTTKRLTEDFELSFPQKFNDGGEVQGSKQPVQTVASATRTTRTGRKNSEAHTITSSDC
jgi:hypothetical protein